MSEIAILIVEDDKDQQSLYSDAISDYNENFPQEKIATDFVATADEAITALGNKRYDAIFIDLLLSGDSASDQASGNNVIEHVLNNGSIRLVVYVVSGTLKALDPRFVDIFSNPLMRKFDRDEDTLNVLTDLRSVLKTGVTKILGRSGRLDTLINDIFFKHLSGGFEFWLRTNNECEKELLRYTALHLFEYLSMPEHNEIEEGKYLNPEFYIYPPIKPSISTGDIVEINSKRYVILSPACDIAMRDKGGKPAFNVEIVVIAELLPLEQNAIDGLGIRYSNWKDFVKNHRGSKPNARFHYMPDYLGISEGLIDFKRISSVPITDILDAQKITRIATVSSPFIRDIQSRFSSYFGRQGQPSGSWHKQ